MLTALVVFASAIAAFAEPPRIFPTAKVLPANHLKFYVHFPEPMREGVFLDYCALLDERGQPVLEPFRETELWSDDRRRLTLWLHPGRQKEGVNLNVEFGPVLEPDRRYTLRISGEWPTATGTPLGKDVEKSFITGPRLTGQLDTTAWKVTAPTAESKEPLEIRFPHPLDHALLLRCLRVVDGGQKAIAGSIETEEGEQLWRFSPADAWTAGDHHVLVESVLEDVAGNSLARPFEVDLRSAPPHKVPQSITLRFQPRW